MDSVLVSQVLISSVRHLKALCCAEEDEKNLKFLLERKEKYEKIKRIYNSRLRKIVEDKQSWMEKFSESIPVSSRNLRIYSKEEFPVMLSCVDYSPEPTTSVICECFIQKISVIPFCRYHETTFPERLNPYDEKIKDVVIEEYGICIFLCLLGKDGDKYEISVDVEPEGFKIKKKKRITFWDISNISGRFPGMVDSISYKSISSKKEVEQFKKMIGSAELSDLVKAIS